MKDKPENQAAFPVHAQNPHDPTDYEFNPGMTKIEYLVGQVLSGDIGGLANTADPIRCAKYAINLADAVLSMLAERSKSNE